MKSTGRSKKIHLLLSVAAIFFITAVLPFHYHAEQNQSTATDHCSICHFSGTARSISPSSPSVGPLSFDQSTGVVEIVASFNAPSPVTSASPRAPPHT